MKIAARIAIGQLGFIALLVAVLLYQISLIHHLQSINRGLSETNVTAAKYSLQLLSDLEQVEEFTQKLFITSDPDYLAPLRSERRAFERHLGIIRARALSAAEQAAAHRLAAAWRGSSQSVFLARPLQSRDLTGPGAARQLETQRAELDRLRLETRRLIQTTTEAIQLRVEQSQRTGQRAELVSYSAAAVAVALSLLVSYLTIRSISRPLGQLVRGTHALAGGDFQYRVDDRGDDELAALAGDFNSMVDQLSKLDQLKKEFVSHVSHELKAPLASMQETTQLLLDRLAGPLNDQQARLLALNLQSGKRLSKMIANLLDLSRMEAEADQLRFEIEDLVALVGGAVAEFEPRTRERDLRLDFETARPPLRVECDGHRILQVVTNLLENAFKFAPAGSTVTVRTGTTARLPEAVPEIWRARLADVEPELAWIAVSDHGPGVPAEHRLKIFEKFHQIKQGSKVAGQGVGLGLAICRRIIEQHRGAIWIEDNGGRGSRFQVLLPLRQPSPVPALPRSLQPVR